MELPFLGAAPGRQGRLRRRPLGNTIYGIRRAGIPEHPGVSELYDALKVWSRRQATK